MQPQFLHLKRPRRVRFYFAAAVGLLYWHLLDRLDGPPLAFLGIALFVAGMAWLGLRNPASGMEIQDGRLTFFVGRQVRVVQLGEIGAVRILGGRHEPAGLWLSLRDGRSLRLPAGLPPDLGALERVLAWRGIPLEA